MERHRVDADPDQDPIFNFLCRSRSDPTPSFTRVGESEKDMTFIQSSVCLPCFIFLPCVLGVKIFSILDKQYIDIFWKKYNLA